MSLKASSWAWEQSIPGTQKLVLLALADYAGRDNASAWPSVTTLAERCSIAERTVGRSLTALQESGLIEIEARPNKTNVYKLAGLGCQSDGTIPSESRYRTDNVTPRQNDTPRQSDGTIPSQCPAGTVTLTPEPVLNRKEPVYNICDDQVEALYDAYPRKAGKPNALKAIKAALKREAAKKEHGMSYQALVEKTKLWATACRQRIEADPESIKFIKHPATWFNQNCYQEEASEWGIKPERQSWQDRETEACLKRIERETAADLAAIQDL